MRHHEFPNIGQWYKDHLHNDIFEVVATDNEGNIEVQFFGGEIEELDIDTWYYLELEEIPAPEDWSGPYEIGREELEYSADNARKDWENPLSEIEPDEEMY